MSEATLAIQLLLDMIAAAPILFIGMWSIFVFVLLWAAEQ